jgi:hypothetical protein
MSEHNEFQDDSLDVVLGGKGQISGDDSLRQAVLAGTLGVIRRRRRLKRCAVATAFLSCYLAGIATVAFWRAGTTDLPKPSTVQIVTNIEQPSAASTPQASELAAIQAYQPTSVKLSQFEVLRQAGDRYLRDPDKMQLAVRTYSRALKYASAEQRAISPEHDTWLLMALKDAQLKEIKHANPQL